MLASQALPVMIDSLIEVCSRPLCRGTSWQQQAAFFYKREALGMEKPVHAWVGAELTDCGAAAVATLVAMSTTL